MDLKDLAKQDPNTITTDVQVKFDNDGNPIEGFKVVGTNSTMYQDVIRQWSVRNVRKSAVKSRAPDARTEEGALDWVNSLQDRAQAIAIACTVGLYGFTDGDGPAVANPETLKRIFIARPAWKDKVVAAVENDALFTTS